jgi:hypothetical protein
MRLTLTPSWKLIVRKAWSIRLLVLAGLLSGVEVILPFFADSLPRGLFAALSFTAVAMAFIARLVAQKEFGDA